MTAAVGAAANAAVATGVLLVVEVTPRLDTFCSNSRRAPKAKSANAPGNGTGTTGVLVASGPNPKAASTLDSRLCTGAVTGADVSAAAVVMATGAAAFTTGAGSATAIDTTASATRWTTVSVTSFATSFAAATLSATAAAGRAGLAGTELRLTDERADGV